MPYYTNILTARNCKTSKLLLRSVIRFAEKHFQNVYTVQIVKKLKSNRQHQVT